MRNGKHRAVVVAATAWALAAAGAQASSADVSKPFAEFWASGRSTKETCNTIQTCISANGTGRLEVSFAPPGPLALLDTYDWTASFTVDTGNATPNGFGGKCAAVGGTVEFSPPNHPSEVLVLDVQGSNCQIGANPALTEITASYRVDPDASTGRFASVTGGGSFNWAADASETPATVNFAGVGAKCFPSSPIRCYPSSPI